MDPESLGRLVDVFDDLRDLRHFTSFLCLVSVRSVHRGKLKACNSGESDVRHMYIVPCGICCRESYSVLSGAITQATTCWF